MKINPNNLKKLGFEIDLEQKRAHKFLNEQRSLFILITKDRSVWVVIDGFKAKTTIKDLEGVEYLLTLFENEDVILPF